MITQPLSPMHFPAIEAHSILALHIFNPPLLPILPDYRMSARNHHIFQNNGISFIPSDRNTSADTHGTGSPSGSFHITVCENHKNSFRMRVVKPAFINPEYISFFQLMRCRTARIIRRQLFPIYISSVHAIIINVIVVFCLLFINKFSMPSSRNLGMNTNITR